MTDKIIIGAGLYGLYAALFCAKKGQSVLVLEQDAAAFSRATYVNQARVHMGYHYPRSMATAMKSAGYFRRFNEDFDFAIHSKFDQIYATSRCFSWTDAKEFKRFCKNAGIPCRDIPVEQYFKDGACDGAFLTEEYTYDAFILRDYFLEELAKYPAVEIRYGQDIRRIVKESDRFSLYVSDAKAPEKVYRLESDFVLNATYASVNQVLKRVEGIDPEMFGLKYELCEIILVDAGEKLSDIGFTVMDGPFFSIMPFGKTGVHSLTSVCFTPHKTCYGTVPEFPCTDGGFCSKEKLGNCNLCPNKPVSAWEYMSALAHKYMRDEYAFTYRDSLFSMKPILKASEIDDSRPTVIKCASTNPTFISVLSGKINTIYDMDEFLI